MQQGRVRAGALVTYTGLVVIAANCIGAELGASSRVAGSATLGHLAGACVALHVLPCELLLKNALLSGCVEGYLEF